LVEFRAGKMVTKGKMVHPIKKKGLVFLNQTEDSLMHFCWKDRTSGQVEDDLIVFPEDAEFKRVSSCTTGRVFVLKFKSSSRRCFYWMQEPRDEKDDEFCSKINEYLNNPPAPGSRSSSGTGGGAGLGSALGSLAELGSLPDADLQNLLNNMNPQQLMQMLGGVGGLPSAGNLAGLLGSGAGGTGGVSSGRTRSSGATSVSASSGGSGSTPSVTSPTSGGSGTGKPSTPAASSGTGAAASGSAPAIQLSDLQSIISGLTVPQQKRDDVNVDLSSSLNYEALQPLLSNEAFMERVKTFLPPTSEGSGAQSAAQNQDDLATTVKSPQFQSALSIFSSAIQSGQLGPLMQQFDLSSACVEAANAGDLEAFVKALQAAEQEKGGASGEKEGDKKGDDAMALD
jgi:hypothetical protein